MNWENDSDQLADDDNLDRCNKIRGVLPVVAEIGFGEYQVECDEYPRYAPTIALTVGTQTLFADTHQYRKVFEPEVIFGTLLSSPDYLRDSHNTAAPPAQITNIGFGWAFVDSATHYHANGPEIRYIWSYPQVDLQLSLYGQYVDYVGPSSAWKLGGGGRIDLGFSYVTGYIKYGKDFGFEQDGVLRPSNILQLGFMIQIPMPWQ